MSFINSYENIHLEDLEDLDDSETNSTLKRSREGKLNYFCLAFPLL